MVFWNVLKFVDFKRLEFLVKKGRPITVIVPMGVFDLTPLRRRGPRWSGISEDRRNVMF